MRILNQISALLLLGMLVVQAREVPVRFILDHGDEQEGTFLMLRNDTVYVRMPAAGADSVENGIYKLEIRRMFQRDNDSLVNLDLRDFVFPALAQETTVAEPLYPAGNGFIRVTSEPEASRIYLNGKDLGVLTPYVIPLVRAGKYDLSVRKYLQEVDWWGAEKIRLKENETLSVHLQVKRPGTELTIISLPEAAEVYLDSEPSLQRMPDYYTDVTIKNIRPRMNAQLRFRKVGYLDTAISTEIVAFMPNMVYVEMEPIKENLAMLEMQSEFNQQRRNKWIGRRLLWGSVAPLLAGGSLWFLAERDWQKAADLKEKYNKSAFASAQTRQLEKDNRSYNRSGDTKMAIGASLGALGLALVCAGVMLQF